MKPGFGDILIVLMLLVVSAIATAAGSTITEKIGIFVAAFVFLFIFIFGIIWLNNEKYASVSRELEPFFQEYGFTPAQPKGSGVGAGSSNKHQWAGKYKNRDFEVSLLFPRKLLQKSDILIVTPNRTGKTPSFKFYERNKMEENGLGDIAARLSAVGIYPFTGFASWWAEFEVDKTQASYTLPGIKFNKENFLESMNIICDTLDRLGI